MDRQEWYRKLPNVNELLHSTAFISLSEEHGRDLVKEQLQKELQKIRALIGEGKEDETKKAMEELAENTARSLEERKIPGIRRVINGTGTVLHTNFGRAPLSEKQLEYLNGIAAGYSNLEYDLEKGKRGERYSHFEELICRITGAEAAMAVNNNAAAVLLVLSALARDGETIVSRGELVEIGGKFRIPDVCEQSGSVLHEVGATNKTHPWDYENAINEQTKVILKAHTSNYRILGFSELVDAENLVKIARSVPDREIPVIEDMGSGAFVDFSLYGLPKEPTVQEEIKKGVDLVTFSGDKLLGGPQAGIIVGKRALIEKIKKHPLTRALRIDKFTVTALNLVLMEYESMEKAMKNIPTLRMLTEKPETLRAKAEALLAKLPGGTLWAELTECTSCVGGGSMPLAELPGFGVALSSPKFSPDAMEEMLRKCRVPVIGHIQNDKLILDVRTMDEKDFDLVAEELSALK